MLRKRLGPMPFVKGALMLGGLLLAATSNVFAQDLKTYSKKGGYEDVKFELNDAIIRRGLAIDYTGHINKMLERTGADVGSTKRVYNKAEFFMFSSEKLYRHMIHANPDNSGYGPYGVSP